jgi:hypothetical protein
VCTSFLQNQRQFQKVLPLKLTQKMIGAFLKINPKDVLMSKVESRDLGQKED